MNFRLLTLALGLLLGGCLPVTVPVPHLEQRSALVTGQIIDSATRAPVKDARVEFSENSALAVLTDANGRFHIGSTSKPELFLGQPAIKLGAKIKPRLRITCEGYAPRELDADAVANIDFAQYAVDPRSDMSFEGPFHLKPMEIDRTP